MIFGSGRFTSSAAADPLEADRNSTGTREGEGAGRARSAMEGKGAPAREGKGAPRGAMATVPSSEHCRRCWTCVDLRARRARAGGAWSPAAALAPAARTGRGEWEGGHGHGERKVGEGHRASRAGRGRAALGIVRGPRDGGGISPKRHLLRDFSNFSLQQTYSPKKSLPFSCLAQKS